MRLKHIYITKEGEPMANPEMEYPDEAVIGDKLNQWYRETGGYKDPEKWFEHAVQRWHSGLLPFEDKKDALDFIPWEYHGYNGTILSQHWNTLIPVELEVEVVEQWNAKGIWLDRPEHRQGTPIYPETKYKYRKVLRIKP